MLEVSKHSFCNCLALKPLSSKTKTITLTISMYAKSMLAFTLLRRYQLKLNMLKKSTEAMLKPTIILHTLSLLSLSFCSINATESKISKRVFVFIVLPLRRNRVNHLKMHVSYSINFAIILELFSETAVGCTASYFF